MSLKALRLPFFVLAFALLAAACAPQANPAAVEPTTALAAIAATDTPAASAPQTATATIAPATSGSTSGGITYTLVAGKTTASYKVSNFFAFQVPAPGAATLLGAAGLLGRRRKA